jgi:hypothetical protein
MRVSLGHRIGLAFSRLLHHLQLRAGKWLHSLTSQPSQHPSEDAHAYLTFRANQRDACAFASGLHQNVEWRLIELAISSSTTPAR